MHKLKILKLKHFITFQNILFINNCLDEERMKSFNKTLLINTINTHQLKRCGFKREKYGYFPILSNVYQTGTNPKCIKSYLFFKSNIQKSKHVSQITFLNTQNNSKNNKQLQMKQL